MMQPRGGICHIAEKLDPRQVATFEELLMTVLYEQEALRRVLVRKRNRK